MPPTAASILYAFLKITGRLIDRIPYPLTLIPACFLGLAGIMLFPGRAGVVLKNIGVVFPHASFIRKCTIGMVSVIHHALSVLELAAGTVLAPEKLEKKLILPQDDLDVLRKGGLLLITVHSGCWELGIMGLGGLINNTCYIYRPLHTAVLDALVRLIRQSRGTGTLPSKGALRQAEDLLRGSGTVVCALDHHFSSREGVSVLFFGRHVSFAPGPAVLQVKTGRDVLIAGFFRDWKTGACRLYRKCLLPASALRSAHAEDLARTLTQEYCAHLEELVAMHPEQYWWFHRVFKKSRSY